MKMRVLFGFLVIIALWYLIVLTNVISPLFLSYPHEVFIRFIHSLFNIQFWVDIGFSISRIVFALLLSCFIGIPLGLIFGYNQYFREIGETMVDFFRSFPIIILLPFFVFLFGIGEISKIITATFSGSLFIILNTIYGVTNSKKERKNFIEILARPSRYSYFTRILFMEALPYIFVGIKVAISLILIVTLVAEMFFGGTAGIGYRIYQSQLSFDSSLMMIYIIITGMLSYFLNNIFSYLEIKMFHWKGK